MGGYKKQNGNRTNIVYIDYTTPLWGVVIPLVHCRAERRREGWR